MGVIDKHSVDARDERRPCPDCAVPVDTPHQDGCDVARCLDTGIQRLSCAHWASCLIELCEQLPTIAYEVEDPFCIGARLLAEGEIVKVCTMHNTSVDKSEWPLREIATHDCGRDVWTDRWPGGCRRA